MKRSLAAIALTAGVVGGMAGGLVLSPGAALGQSSTPTQSSAPSTEKGGSHLAEALAPLVANGTITQAQADKVIAALQAARPHRGPGHRAHLKLGIALGTLAERLGMTVAELRTALSSGQSIADIARSKDVPVQSLIDALVASAKVRLAEKVAAGDLTQAQADARLAKLTEQATAAVNGELPKLFGRRGRAVRPGSTQPSTSNTVLRTA